MITDVQDTVDKLLVQHRIPNRIFVFNIDSELRMICYPNYRRQQEIMFNKYKKEHS
jgi:hypothetical protein